LTGTRLDSSPPGIDLAALRGWLRDALPEASGPLAAELISGGKSNLTYRLRIGADLLVLRRPPLGNVLPTAHDMEREYRVLGMLADTEIPVSRPLAFCADTAVLGAPFYVMEHVAGATISTMDDARGLTAAQAAELSQCLAATLAAVHRVDITSAGWQAFGRPTGFLDRQIALWWRQWESSRTRELPDVRRLVALLEERRPDSHDATLVHGDFRVDNTLIELAAPVAIAAVVDWEMSTIGHPLADLGMALAYWADNDDAERLAVAAIPPVTAVDGFYSSAEFAAAYAAESGRELTDLDFYVALGCFKLAVILEGIHSRHLARNTVGDGFDNVGQDVPVLIGKGLRLLGGSPASRAEPSSPSGSGPCH
jgi:aminoglycoside phosphotransferase (APT) family kinase protein